MLIADIITSIIWMSMTPEPSFEYPVNDSGGPAPFYSNRSVCKIALSFGGCPSQVLFSPWLVLGLC